MQLSSLKLKQPHLSITQWWLIALLFVLCATIFVAGHAIMLFIDASRADAVPQPTGSGVESISRETLQETIATFEARIREFQSMRRSDETVSEQTL